MRLKARLCLTVAAIGLACLLAAAPAACCRRSALVRETFPLITESNHLITAGIIWEARGEAPGSPALLPLSCMR